MMTSLDDLKLQSLSRTGTVNITRIRTGDEWGKCYIVLIMGPTGAGKSSFVEALAGPNSSLDNLSSGQLEGHTQDVSAYRVHGITWGNATNYSICLIDTPGFADEKISSMEIVTKVQTFLRQNGGEDVYVPYILHLTPITSTRLPGSQRQVLKTFKALTGSQASGGLTIVTTMWDTVWGDSAQQRADRNFEQLTKDMWTDFTNMDTQIQKFYNTQESAIEILDLAFARDRRSMFNIENAIRESTAPSKTAFSEEMYTDLVERIQSLRMKKENLITDLSDPSMSQNTTLKSLLDSDLSQVNAILVKFEQQLVDLVPAPTVQPQAGGSSSLVKPASATSSSHSKSRGKEPVARVKGVTKRLINKITRRDAH